MRVHEVAKELGLTSKEAIAALNALDVEVKSHANAVSDVDVERLKESMGGDGSQPGSAEPEAADEAPSQPTSAATDDGVVTVAEETAAEVAVEPDGEPAVAAAESAGEPEPDSELEVEDNRPTIVIEEGLSVGKLAGDLKVSPVVIIRELMSQGIMANMNQALDLELAAKIADAHGFAATILTEDDALLGEREEGDAEDIEPRAPVVTIMGHVDHGKTHLLDSIRETNVIAREAGGITQHIGASEVEWRGNRIVFIDTPGHQAFTRMRARGAQVTDIVVLVVAADDGVMPQTVEAIDHARAAGVPIIVAINKIDRPEANIERVMQQLTERGLQPEEWGGETVCVPVSAKMKSNLDGLLEYIVLTSELLELKANPKVPARGIVLEAQLDRQRGPLATLLVQEGTLQIGTNLIAGAESCRVRAITTAMGSPVKTAPPATAVEVLGFSGVPKAGDSFQVVEEVSLARRVADIRRGKLRRDARSGGTRLTFEDLHMRLSEGQPVTLPVILKADAQGSVEVLRDALTKVSTAAVKVEILHASVGGVSETDVLLATASDAIIVGFNVRPERGVADIASGEKVDLRLYTIIYQLIDEVKLAMVGKLEPTYEESSLGSAEVRDTFRVPRSGSIAGCYITEGKITRDAKARLLRDSRIIYEGRVGSLRRFKDDVAEVQQGYECGIGLANFNDVKIGDVIEAFSVKEIAPTL